MMKVSISSKSVSVKGSTLRYPSSQEFTRSQAKGARLDEAEGAGQVVQVPPEAAVVEIDNLYLVVFHKQVGQAQVGVNEAERALAHAVTLEASLDGGAAALKLGRVLRGQPLECLPGTPRGMLADDGVVRP